MNQLEKWHRNGVIRLSMCWTAQAEASTGHGRRRSQKAWGYTAPLPLITTRGERDFLDKISVILFGRRPKSAAEERDCLIVFTAKKYFAVLITNDGGSKTQPRGILGSRDDLATLGVTVMRDWEAVDRVRLLIQRRDQEARWAAERFALPLPN
jgi:hypothetical protein